MLRRQLTAAFMIALMLAVAGAVFAEWRGRQALQGLIRAAAANQTFDGFQELGTHADQILRLLSEAAITGEFDRAASEAVEARLSTTIETLRHRIAIEIGLDEGAGAGAQEADELQTLARLEGGVRRGLQLLKEVRGHRAAARRVWLRSMDLLDSREPDGFREDLNAAIAGERLETAKSEASAEAAMASLRRAATVYALGSVVLLLVLTRVFVGRLRKPVKELVAATQAMKAGDLERRVRLATDDEFGLIASHFNALAEQRQQQQTALAQAHDRLEETVARRTDELRVANERLTGADATRRQLFADISHELRTPITAIRGEAEIALRGGTKPVDDYRLALTQVSAISGQMGRLIDDLLFIARSEAGAQRMDLERVALGELLETVCREARSLGGGHGIDIRFEPPSREVAVLGDDDRLHQLFMILLDNAIRHSEASHPIRVWCFEEAGRVTVGVVDHGVGIAEYELVSVFRRFYRGDRAHSKDGAGLGLPIAKVIVNAHGGTIEIDSVAGTGTTVRVTLATHPVAEELA